MTESDPGDFKREPDIDLFPDLPKPAPPLAGIVSREELGRWIEEAFRASGVVLVRRDDLRVVVGLAERTRAAVTMADVNAVRRAGVAAEGAQDSAESHVSVTQSAGAVSADPTPGSGAYGGAQDAGGAP